MMMRGESRPVPHAPRQLSRGEGSDDTNNEVTRCSKRSSGPQAGPGIGEGSGGPAGPPALRIVVDGRRRPSLDDIAELQRSLPKERRLGGSGRGTRTRWRSAHAGWTGPQQEASHWLSAAGAGWCGGADGTRGRNGAPGHRRGRVINAGRKRVVRDVADTSASSATRAWAGQCEGGIRRRGRRPRRRPGDEGEPDGQLNAQALRSRRERREDNLEESRGRKAIAGCAACAD